MSPHLRSYHHALTAVIGALADTITIPDDVMLEVMAGASVGDDVYKQDHATNALQDRVAKLAGKEAALFCVSGTMTNREWIVTCRCSDWYSPSLCNIVELAIRTHLTQPPHSVVCDTRAHIQYVFIVRCQLIGRIADMLTTQSIRSWRYCLSFASPDNGRRTFQWTSYDLGGYTSKSHSRSRYPFCTHETGLFGKHPSWNGLSSRRDYQNQRTCSSQQYSDACKQKYILWTRRHYH